MEIQLNMWTSPYTARQNSIMMIALQHHQHLPMMIRNWNLLFKLEVQCRWWPGVIIWQENSCALHTRKDQEGTLPKWNKGNSGSMQPLPVFFSCRVEIWIIEKLLFYTVKSFGRASCFGGHFRWYSAVILALHTWWCLGNHMGWHRDWTWVSCVQGKCPTHCTITPTPKAFFNI